MNTSDKIDKYLINERIDNKILLKTFKKLGKLLAEAESAFKNGKNGLSSQILEDISDDSAQLSEDVFNNDR